MAPPLRRGHGARGTGGTDALRILLHERGEANPEAFHPNRAMRPWQGLPNVGMPNLGTNARQEDRA